jgi:hypothetical protein
MKIELTDEMRQAYREAVRQGGDSVDDIRDAGLSAVLEIVARDLPDAGLVARRAYENGQRDERALTDMGF